MYGHPEKKILYLAAPKTASTSTGQALVSAGFDNTHDHHAPMFDIGLRKGAVSYYDIDSSWKILTTVRNHFDALVSWVMYRPYCKTGVTVSEIQQLLKRDVRYFQPQPDGSFRMWDEHTPVATDILRFETLQEDLDRTLGFHVEIPHANRSIRREYRPYQDFYDTVTKQFVYDLFGEEIEKYGYKF